MRHTYALYALCLFGASASCRCSTLSDEVDDQSFTRCLQADPPAERKLKIGAVTLSVRGRTADVSGRMPLTLAAFTGPVAGSLTRADIADLAAHKPGLIVVLGGIGDDLASATATLSSLAGLAVPTLLIPGGADRLALIEQALSGLAAGAADGLVLAAGLHELRVGRQRFALLPGAPDGRYAIDAAACGFVNDDTAALADTMRSGKGGRPWLLSWAAPAGFGATNAPGVGDIGSPQVAALMTAIGARGGVFAWPEGGHAKATGDALVAFVPRLGRSGTLGEAGSRRERGVLLLQVSESGLVAGP